MSPNFFTSLIWAATGSLAMASVALLPSCAPMTLPARSFLTFTGDALPTMMIWWLAM
ncbi:hypothetical protein D3C85_1451120 [compost metagenome]